MRLKIITAMAGTLLVTPALAQESYPSFSADFVFEVQSDQTFSSTDPAAEINNTFATFEAALQLSIASGASINASLVFEPVIDPVDDSFFEDHGLYVEELYFAYEVEGVTLTLGKFNPAFGEAWDTAPGLYGVDFAEDYELTERLGAGIAIPFDAFDGEHELSLAIFAADTTALSDSVIQNRGLTRSNSGGVSNTQSPESAALAIAGGIGDTGYNVGLQYQSKGDGDTDDQFGFVVGVNQAIPFSEDSGAEVLAEIAYFPNSDGGPDSALFGTLGAAVPVGPVTLSGVYSVRDVDNVPTDHLGTVSAEMELVDGLTAGLGYRFGREGGETSHTVGALLVYEIGFSTE